MTKAGTAYIDVDADWSSFNRKFASESRGLASKAGKLGKGLGKGVAGGVAIGVGAGLLAAKASIADAVDLGEEVSKTSVVFRGSEKAILNWSKTTAGAIGVSRREALEATGVFGNMLVPMGLARGEAGKMSKRMVGLAADLASFNNASPEETLDALRAGLAGESEPLRRFGVFLNDARLKEEAMSLGLYKGKGTLDAAAKARATYNLILKDTKDAQGDVTRTSSSLANQERIAKAQIENISASVGKLFIPALEDASGVTTKFLGAVDKIAQRTDLNLGEKLKLGADQAKIDFGPIAEDLTREVRELDLGRRLGDAVDDAVPVIAEHAARAAPHAAAAFVRAFSNTDIWGQLLIGGLLIKKMGGTKALRALGFKMGTEVAAGTAAGAAAGAGGGAVAGAAGGGFLAGAKRVARRTAVAGLAINAVNQSIKPGYQSGMRGIGERISGSLAFLPGVESPLDERAKRTKEQIDEIRASVSQLAAAGNSEGLKQLRKDFSVLFGQESFYDTTALKNVGRELDDLIQHGPKIAGVFEYMRKSTTGSITAIRSAVATNFDRIGRTMDAGSSEGREALARNFRRAAQEVQVSMDAGVISTAAGMREIRRLLRDELAELGVTGKVASSIVKHGNINPGEGGGPRGARGRRPQSGAGAYDANARGGLFQIGRPGDRGRDRIAARIAGQDVKVGSGEVAAVFNRHQLPIVNERLADMGGLPGLFERVNKPHYLASGGVVGKLPSVRAVGSSGMLGRVVQGSLDKAHQEAEERLAKLMAEAALATPMSGGARSTKGLVDQVVRALGWARAHGWQGQVISGFRSRADQVRINADPSIPVKARPGTSEHEFGRAVDVTDIPGFARAMATAPGGARLFQLLDQGLRSRDPAHFSVSGRARGGIIAALTAGGLPAIAKAIGRVRPGKSPRVRGIVDQVKGIGLPRDLERKLADLAKNANIYGDRGDRAGQLTVDAPEGGAALQGVVDGKTQVEWLTEQLATVFKWRNAIIRAERIAVAKREDTTKLIEQTRARIAGVAGEISEASGERASLGRRLEGARKHPNRNKALIKALKARIAEIDHAQKKRTGLREALRERVLPALSGQRSTLATARGDLLSTLDDVQGVGSPTRLLDALPQIGALGGQIFEIQNRLRDLGAPPEKITDPDTGAGDLRAELLEQLLKQETLRRQVSERQFDVFRNMPPYGGSFDTGGVVPGPHGAPRTIVAHGGETITPPGDGSRVRVIVEDHRTRVLIDDVEHAVEQVTRRQARHAGRALPGRGGGGLG